MKLVAMGCRRDGHPCRYLWPLAKNKKGLRKTAAALLGHGVNTADDPPGHRQDDRTK